MGAHCLCLADTRCHVIALTPVDAARVRTPDSARGAGRDRPFGDTGEPGQPPVGLEHLRSIEGARVHQSATTSGRWLGSITPPVPTRMREVAAATAAASTVGAEPATPGTLWCSETQNR
jgi:hypothetical protein